MVRPSRNAGVRPSRNAGVTGAAGRESARQRRGDQGAAGFDDGSAMGHECVSSARVLSATTRPCPATVGSAGSIVKTLTRVQWVPCPSPSAYGFLRARRASSTSAARGPRSSTGPSPGATAARSSSASRTPTASAPPRSTRSPSSDALQWLGLDWDEGPFSPGYRQTERYRGLPRPRRAPAAARAARTAAGAARRRSTPSAGGAAAGRHVPLRPGRAATPTRRPPSPTCSAFGRRRRRRRWWTTSSTDASSSSTPSSTTSSSLRTRRHADLQLLRRASTT